MARVLSSGSDRPVPILDTGEQTRLDFWREHSQALPRELLEITGWLSREPAREVLAERAGRVEAIKAAEAPNALFRVPEAGPAREKWHAILTYVRQEQLNRQYLDGRLRRAMSEEEQARTELDNAAAESERVDRELGKARDHQSELQTRARITVTELREAYKAGHKLRAGPIAKAARLVQQARDGREVGRLEERARRATSERRVLEQRLSRVRAEIEYRRQRSAEKVLIGFHGEINAFWDLQALSTASVASEEFRRRPARHIQSTSELEAVMDGDDGG